MREIEKKFLALLKSDVEVSEPTEKITPLDVGKMSEYVVQLVKVEADYPEPVSYTHLDVYKRQP